MTQNPSHPLRVAIVCAVDLSVHALLRTQIQAIQEAGYDVVTFCSDGPYVEALRKAGFKIETVEIPRAIRPWKDLKALLKLRRAFRGGRFAIVHTHTPKAAFLAQLAAWFAWVPVRINTVHGLYYLAFGPGLYRWAYKMFEIFTCRLSTYVFSQSQEDVALMLRGGLVNSDRLEWLGNGIDLKRFRRSRFASDEGARVRDEMRIPRDAFVVGIVARMVNEKGFRELFEAFSKLREAAPNAYLLHIGPIDRSRNDEVTPERAQRYGIADFCRFTGERNDVARLMTAMDIFCLPSYREGYPRSVMEACAMGLPAIVTNIRGCREAVIDGLNGLLVPARKAKPLAQALQQLHDDDELRRRLARGARERAESDFDETIVTAKILRAYAKLVILAVPSDRSRRPPKVHVVAAVLSTFDAFLSEQIQGMRSAGYDVNVVCSPDPLLEQLRVQGVTPGPVFIPRAIRPVHLARAMWQLWRMFRISSPDIVHTHTPIAAFIGQWAAWLARVPHRFTTVHGLYFVNEHRPAHRFMFKYLEVIACRLATKVICVSEEDRQYLIDEHGLEPSKIQAFHVGVNLDLYSPSNAGDLQRQEVRADLKIPADAVVFGIVARMVREKGFLELFEAFGRLRARHDNVYLLHVGPVDRSRGDEVTPEAATRYGCDDRCRFVGMRRDVPRYLAAMDVLCLPTHREGFPVSVMEAAAVGLACITTNIRGCREAVVDGKTGLIVPVHDAAALAAAMEKLLASPTLRQELARNAFAHARINFDRRKSVDRTLAMYQDALGPV